MPLEIGQPISSSVDVVCTSLVPPVIARGRITHFDGLAYDLEIDEPVPPISVGAQVILDLTEIRGARVIATISEVQGSHMKAAQKAVSEPDKRAFPRLYGSVDLAFRAIKPDESEASIDAWISSGLETAGESWHSPDPFMNFSVTGLKFEEYTTHKIGDVILLGFTVPTSESIFRCRGKVARCKELPNQSGVAIKSNSIAVEFLDMSPEGREALSEFTLLIQGVLL
tara:strand:- start:1022 stop:1699 length:678 start_codon:yes stop_codon:yes gene_type:complete